MTKRWSSTASMDGQTKRGASQQARARSRAELRAMGVPEDMTEDDVKAFFSLPDDDDSMHQQRTR